MLLYITGIVIFVVAMIEANRLLGKNDLWSNILAEVAGIGLIIAAFAAQWVISESLLWLICRIVLVGLALWIFFVATKGIIEYRRGSKNRTKRG